MDIYGGWPNREIFVQKERKRIRVRREENGRRPSIIHKQLYMKHMCFVSGNHVKCVRFRGD